MDYNLNRKTKTVLSMTYVSVSVDNRIDIEILGNELITSLSMTF